MSSPSLDAVIAAHGFLDPNDPVAISFWIISISMVASTVFFLMESTTVNVHWKTSLNVGALVTLVAAVHYFYMREFWVQIHSSPILYRYIDWSITVPLQMIEFFLILKAVTPSTSSSMFFRLFLGTVWMLASGYAGEAHFIPAQSGFVSGMAGRDASKANKAVGEAFTIMRQIVTVGWAIYPAGYFFGYLCGTVDASTLNLVY